MKNRLLFFVFFLLSSAIAVAQQGYVDELKAIVQQNKQDSASALAYNRLLFMGEDYGVTQSGSMLEKALELDVGESTGAKSAFQEQGTNSICLAQ